MNTALRSTWVTASIQAVRERGHYERYVALLSDGHRDAILSAVAGTWLPSEVAIAHYIAVDGLLLPEAEVLEIGRQVASNTQKTVLSLFSMAARGVGVTPWAMFAHMHRIWERGCEGGGLAAWRVGPKEARIEVVQWPFARIRYCRVSLRGVMLGLTHMFCRQAYAREVRSLCTPTTLGYTLSWA